MVEKSNSTFLQGQFFHITIESPTASLLIFALRFCDAQELEKSISELMFENLEFFLARKK